MREVKGNLPYPALDHTRTIISKDKPQRRPEEHEDGGHNLRLFCPYPRPFAFLLAKTPLPISVFSVVCLLLLLGGRRGGCGRALGGR